MDVTQEILSEITTYMKYAKFRPELNRRETWEELVTMSVASANDFQIPTNANVAFPVGTVINVIQIGAGQTTIKAVTSGTTTISSTGATATAPKLRAQYSAASCIKVATDTWYVVGDIA